MDRLTRWATRDGGDGSAVAAAVRAVLDEYLPGLQRSAPRSPVRVNRNGPADADGRDGTAPCLRCRPLPRMHAAGCASGPVGLSPAQACPATA